jgi:uncharacterized protein (DUF305 family)
MKKQTKLVLILATTVCSLSACNNGSTANETKDTTTNSTAMTDSNKTNQKMEAGQMKPMSSMTEKMNGIKLTGDFDNDFAALMIEHHQGAVDMSEMELSKGADAQMKKMAQTMVTDHKSEIEQLKSCMSHHDPSSPEHKKEKAHTHSNGDENDLSTAMKMETEKMSGIQMTGNADKDYAMMMQAHHEDAIKMSKAEIAHGHHAELKKMAQKMMNDDAKEIKEFQKFLSSQK